ncbi:MAG: WD40 repeat domain-containing serine/threonine-protein kinase, partial [Elainellaceae cyanobacterium]
MSYCFNPNCPDPGVQRMRHLESAQFCSNCGALLQLIDRYRATVRVGDGQFGQTFLAMDETTGRRCVIRQVPKPSSDCALLRVDALRQRSQALRQLNSHPQLPALLAWFTQQAHYYWVFRFVDGPTLDHSKIALDATDILRLLAAAVPLLQTLHDAGVYHGDIKPANLILAPLSTASGEGGSQMHLVGSDFGRPYDDRSAAYSTDLHHLGRLCAYLLTPNPKLEWSAFDGQIPPIADAALRTVLSRLIGTTPPAYASATEAAIAISALLRRDGPTLVPDPPSEAVDDAPLEAAGWLCRYTLQGHEAWVRSVAVSADGHWVISGSGDKTVKVWSVETGALRYTLRGHDSWVRAVAASSNAPVVASASNDKTIQIWNLDTGQATHVLWGHTDWIRAVAFLPGNCLASAAQDKAIFLWDIASETVTHRLLGHQHWVLTMAVTAEGTQLVSGSRDRTLRLWDLASGQCRLVLTGHDAEVTCVTVCPQTGAIISGSADKTIRYWNPDTGECIHVITCLAGVNSLAIQPSQQFLAAGCSDKTIGLWTLDRQPLGSLVGHSNWVWSVRFSEAAPVLVSGSWDGT